jgi:hypothetical protein
MRSCAPWFGDGEGVADERVVADPIARLDHRLKTKALAGAVDRLRVLLVRERQRATAALVAKLWLLFGDPSSQLDRPYGAHGPSSA